MAKKTLPKKPIKKPIPSGFGLSKLRLKDLVLPIVIVAVVILLGIFRGQFVAAIVNGEQISRIELIRELEKADGKRILDSLVTQLLITQEAKKRNVSAADEEIHDEIAKIEKNISDQGQKLDDLLAIQNFTRKQLGEQVRMQILLQKMVGENIQVTDIEVNDYIEQNRELLPEDASMDEIRTNIEEQLKQQKLNEKIQELIQKLQQEAKIDYPLTL